jgi:hypothetical protein
MMDAVAKARRLDSAMAFDRDVMIVYDMHIPLIPNDVVPPATAAKACSI